MKKLIPLLVVLLIILPSLVSSQVTRLRFKERQFTRFAKKVQTDVLNVVIENEKNPEDAALVSAVKKYWTIGTFKFISLLEFTNSVKNNQYRSDELFLFKTSFLPPAKMSRIERCDYVIGNNPGSSRNQFEFFYSLPNNGYDLKGKVLDGYFDLMIKYFDHELLLVKSPEKRKAIKKARKKKITFFVDDIKELKDKDILYVKELINFSDAKNVKEKTEKSEELKKMLFKKFKVQPARIYTVFPEDISMAVSKGDSKVLIFDGTDLIDPSDGSVKVTSYTKPFDAIKLAYGTIIGTFTFFIGGIIYGTTIWEKQ